MAESLFSAELGLSLDLLTASSNLENEVYS